MRGGTSKAVFFNRSDLPADEKFRDMQILRIFGAPDLREIDGLGGADPLTSKVAIIGPSTRDDCDVDYLFGQVNMIKPMIDWKSNCGNISSAVGPYAIDEGFIDAVEPITKVRIHQVNTNKVIVADIPVRDNKAEIEGDYRIAGVPGTGAKIVLDWADSAGAMTGKLLPTGNQTDILHVENEGNIEISIVDAALPLVFVRAKDLGLNGNETPQKINDNGALLSCIEKIRSLAAEKIGLCRDRNNATNEVPYAPFFAICAPPMSYRNWMSNEKITGQEVDIVVKLLFMQQMHKTYPVSGAICTTAAAMIPGTIPNQYAKIDVINKGVLRIGHPAGVITSKGKLVINNGHYELEQATVDRTARCLMKGYAFIPKIVSSGNTIHREI